MWPNLVMILQTLSVLMPARLQDAEALAGAAVAGREEAEAEVERLKDVAAAVQAKVQATADIVAKMSGDLERAEVRRPPPAPPPLPSQPGSASPPAAAACCHLAVSMAAGKRRVRAACQLARAAG